MNPPPSLVRGSKSSTQYNLTDFGDPYLLNMQRLEKDAALAEGLANGTLERVYPPNLETAGRFVTLICEDWRSVEQTPEGAPYTPLNADNALWNATLTTETLCKSVPPRQSGDRWTDKLSPRAKKKIEYSALYMHRMG